MSNATSVTLTFITFLAGLAGFAWAISWVAGGRFWTTFGGVVAAYIVLLTTYVCWRRVAQKIRLVRARRFSQTNART